MFSIIGLGYVGSANATFLAKSNDVYIYDIDSKKVDALYLKKPLIKDKELSIALKDKNIKFIKGDFFTNIKNSEFVLIATSTNFDVEKENLDISSICDVISKVKDINPDVTFIIRSTVPIGTCRYLKEKYKINNLIFMPEFLKEGESYLNTVLPSRLIFGYDKSNEYLTKKVDKIEKIYTSLSLDNKVKIFHMNYEEAESTKLFSNTFLALRVAYFNELDTFAKMNNLSSKDIIEGVCADSRIGNFYNNPSFGYGGYCLPKDSRALKSLFKNIPNNIISSCIDANETRKEFIANDILTSALNISSNPTIGFYLLTMKKDSDNYRESSSLKLLELLKNKNVNLLIYEPLIKEDEFNGIKVIKNLDEFLSISTLVVMNRINKNIKHSHIYSRDIFNKD
ncbi:MAG: nucleotide sugar dehydrogenase [Bacilli bacterium]